MISQKSISAAFLLLVALSTGQQIDAADSGTTPAQTQNRSANQTVRLRGRIVDPNEERHRPGGTGSAANHDPVWALKTQDGKLHRIVRTRSSEAIFLDDQLRRKELMLYAHFLPENNAIE